MKKWRWVGLPSEKDCEGGILVKIKWQDRMFAVPLEQLKGIDIDEKTEEAIDDWYYWIAQKYEF